MTVYIDEVTLTSGTAAGTFGTTVNLTLNAKARRVFAIQNSGCDTVYTTASPANGVIVSLNSSSLSITDQRLLFGPYESSGPATNSSGQGMVVETTLLNYQTQGNEVIGFAAALTAAGTTGTSNMVTLMYYDSPPPGDWRRQFPITVPALGGYVAAASQLTTTATALTTIQVPTWVNEFTASKALTLKTGAITAAQYQQGYFSLTSSIPDITPMKIITNSEGSTLGTPVGTGQYNDRIDFQPLFFNNAGGAQTLVPNINLINTVSTGNTVAFGTQWRK